MAIDSSGRWCPKIFDKQAELINACRSGLYRFILSSGPRLSGKTLGCLHAIVDHAWNVNNANVAVVSVTQSAGYDSGVWTDLTELIIPEWIEGDFGLQWVKPPSVQHVSKKPYCVIRNRFGGKSKFQLESLKNEQEVETRFKSKRYSAMFINELSNFKKRKTLDTWSECLRMVNLPPEKHFILCDTNPADEGTKSWIYSLWFEMINRLDEDLTDDGKALKKLLKHIEITIDDNVFAPPERISQLKAMLASNRDLYARYVQGKWVTASLDALFIDVFREDFHVRGGIETPANPNPEILSPEPECYELFTGWDLGVRNSAACILEKVFDPNETYRRPIFKALDELVIVGEDFLMEDFVQEFVKKMWFWQLRCPGKVRWTHYSDRSAFDMKDVSSNRYHHQIVFDACPDTTPGGRIQLIAAERGPSSAQKRVDLFRKLLWEDRIFFSNNFTPQAIEMIKSIRRGKTTVAPIEKGSPHKHIFDALMYPIGSECWDEMEVLAIQLIRRKFEEDNDTGYVRVPL